MNNKFDWNRFCKVVNKDFRNMWPAFGIGMIILAALPFSVWLLALVFGKDSSTIIPDIRVIMIECMAMIASIMAPSRLYRTWNLRNEGIYYAMLPASKQEKIVSAALFTLVVCPLMVFVGGIVVDMVLTVLPFGPYSEWLWQGEMGFPFTLDFSAMDQGNEVNLGGFFIAVSWMGYILSVATFFFTSTLFKKHKVLLTIAAIYAIEFALSIIIMPIMMALGASNNFEWIARWMENTDPQTVINTICWCSLAVDALLIVLFSWLSWRRLDRMAY